MPVWIRGEGRPTYKQLEALAKATYTPFGYFFLSEPPEESIPIPDLRTIGNRFATNPSLDLLETVYLCQQRQSWFRDFMQSTGEKPLPFVGSASLKTNVKDAARDIGQVLCFNLKERSDMATWTEALRHFGQQADSLGIMVMVSGIVGSNTRRSLDPQEFRGFALADPLAPLVFVNGNDSKAAQMFTMAHELAHIWLGETALSDLGAETMPSHEVEAWCNEVAGELLVPAIDLKKSLTNVGSLSNELYFLARKFKVSTLVVLRRLYDIGQLTSSELWRTYSEEKNRLPKKTSGKGGDFYRTLSVRVGRRFARALIASTFEGNTSFTETFRLLGVRKMATLRQLGHDLGVLQP